jgi:diguanylate cyclase (GGDEF)-like protein
MSRTEAPQRPQEPFRVMVADDDESVRRLLRTWLERDDRFAYAGEVADGGDVIDDVAATAPDALILDLSMPQRDGLSILAELREQGSDVAVVVFSAAAREDVAETVSSYDRSSFVGKGSSLAELASALTTHIGSRVSKPAPARVPRGPAFELAGGFAFLVIAALLGLAAPRLGSPRLVAGFAVAIAATFALPVRRIARSGGGTMQLDGHIYVALAMLLPPAGAALAAVAGVSVGLVLARPRRTPVRIFYATCLFALQTYGQSTLFAHLTSAGDASWVAPVAGCTSYLLGLAWNLAGFALMLQWREGIGAGGLLRRHLPTALRLAALVMPVGALVGIIGHRHPTALAFLAVPQVVLLLAARYDSRTRRERDALHQIVRSTRLANLASTPREVEEHLRDLAREIVDPEVRLSRTEPKGGVAVSLGQPGGPWLVIDGITAEDAALLELIAAVGVPTRENARLRAKETFEARHDPLTGLANPRLLGESLERTTAGYRQSGTAFSILYVDLDSFKPINDLHGHAIGDEVLRTVARRMQGVLRPFDLVARGGGDEFVAVIAGVGDRGTAERVAADLRAAVEAPIRLPGGLSVRVGVSIGIAVCPHDDETADELLRVADHRMYADKRSRKRRHGMTAKA